MITIARSFLDRRLSDYEILASSRENVSHLRLFSFPSIVQLPAFFAFAM